jgi:hypothetical protein
LLEEESSEAGTPRNGTPERQDGSDGEVVPDEIEVRVTIRNTFIHLEPVASELSLKMRAVRRHKTAPEILLAAAFARRKKGVDNSKGLKNASGNRPGKKARERYQALVAKLEGMVRQDPLFSLESFPLPHNIQCNEELKAKLVARVETARLAAY